MPVLGLLACEGGSGTGDKESGNPADDTGKTEVHYEPGCITVDGGGGYKYIQDAITVASEGSVIALCNGTYEEAVTVDKGVSITGETLEGTIISAPANSAAFTITGSGASLSTFTINTTKDGILFDGAQNSSVSNFVVIAPPNYGVAFNNAISSSISDCTIDTPGYTGVKIAGGSASVSRCSFPQATSYTVTVTENADATLEGNTFDGVVATTDEDGYAVRVDTATAHFNANQFIGADTGAISGDTATLTMDGDQISNMPLGIVAGTTSLDAKNLNISEAYIIGILVSGQGRIALADSVISVTDDSACSNPYSSFWSSRSRSLACGGLVGQAAKIALSNVTIANYDTYGIYLVTHDTEVGSAFSLDGVSLENVGRIGMALFPGSAGTVDLRNSSVTDLREPELPEPCGDMPSQTGSYSLANTPAVYGEEGTWTVDGMNVTNSAGWGLAIATAKSTISNSTIDGYSCAGIINLQGAATISGNTFTHGAKLGGVWDYQGSTLVTGNTFTDNHYITRYDYSDGTYYISNGGGTDIQAGQSSDMQITENVFRGGDQSIQLYQVAAATVSDNTWNDYDSLILSISDSANPVMEHNTITNSYGYIASIYGSAAAQGLEVKDLEITDTRPTHETYGYYNADGTPQYEGEYDSTSYYGFYAYNGAFDLTDITVASADLYYLLYLNDSSLALDGLDLDSSTYLMTGSYSATPPDVLLQNLSIGTLGDRLATITNYSGQTGSFYLTGSTVDQANGILTLTGSVDVVVDDVIASALTGNAFFISSTSYDTDGDGVAEFLLSPGVQLSNITIDSVGGDGAYVEADQVLINNVEFGSAESGLYVPASSSTPTYVEAVDLRVGNATSEGVHVEAMDLMLDSVSVENAAGNGYYLSGNSVIQHSSVGTSANGVVAMGGLELSDVSLGDASDGGLFFSGGNMNVDGASLTSAGGYGVYASGADLKLVSSMISNAQKDAIYLDGATLTVTDSIGYSVTGNGLTVKNGNLDAQNNIFSGNAGYGMSCEAVTISACSANDLSSNILGEQLDCSETCGI